MCSGWGEDEVEEQVSDLGQAQGNEGGVVAGVVCFLSVSWSGTGARAWRG
jgi:hypothetical protein